MGRALARVDLTLLAKDPRLV